MQIQLIRHATLLLTYAGKRILVDPMLGEVGINPPVANTPNQRPNPLVPLPQAPEPLLSQIGAVIVTHLHRDHWDDAAARLIPPDMPLFCQPTDTEKLGSQGFANLQPVEGQATQGEITLHRTGGRHGTGAIGLAMGKVSGFVLKHPNEPTLYIAGDTIWCDCVETALARHQPDVAVVNAGAARFLTGGPITMTAVDVAEVTRRVPQVIAVHMEAINHCLLTRAELRAVIPEVIIPADGETLTFSNPLSTY